MTLQERADAFQAAFPDCAKYGGGLHVSPSAQGFDKFFASWTGGADYRAKKGKDGTTLFGQFPPYFLPRIFSIFPDARRVLHLFSGSLTAEQVGEAWCRVPLNETMKWPHAQNEGGPVDSVACYECRLRYSLSLSNGKCPKCGRAWVPPPTQVRFDNGLLPAAKAAKPDVIGDAENLVGLMWRCAECGDATTQMSDYPHHSQSAEPFDLIIADPPYRLADQHRYWYESMLSLQGKCVECGEAPSMHRAVYFRDKRGELRCPEDKGRPRGQDDSRWDQEMIGVTGYVRFKPLDKTKVVHECAKVLKPGGFLVWLDTQWPMHSKLELRTVGHITLIRSTQHLVRMATILERAG